MRSGVHLRGLARGNHSFEETSQWCPAVGDTEPDLIGLGIELQISRADNVVFDLYANWRVGLGC